MDKRILIVDDEPDLTRILTILFEAFGYQTQTATDGVQALSAARTDPPDLIVMDVMMPGLNGYEACAKLKKDPATARVPIIMLSAKAQQTDRLMGIDAGADAYLSKPFENALLLQKVRELIG